MASTGIFQVAIEQLKRASNTNIVFLPYPGNAGASNALLGGHITSLFAVYPTVAELLKSGKLRALAVASRKRIETLPDVPTVIESGYPDYEVESWSGLVAPAKTPPQEVEQIGKMFSAALAAPEIKSKVAAMNSSIASVCGGNFVNFLRKEYEDTGRLIRDANIKGN